VHKTTFAQVSFPASRHGHKQKSLQTRFPAGTDVYERACIHVSAFISQKGGVGKTTLAIHLATAFVSGGYNTALLDLDLRPPPRNGVTRAMKSSS
jgi:Mrp family chromosome partitioning ATPase